MPSGLKRYYGRGHLHFLTFSCYRRRPLLKTARSRDAFMRELRRVRDETGFRLIGYVVMPEHVHLLISEPERRSLALALQMLKQTVSQKLGGGSRTPFWQPRYYDFNVWSERKRVEKLRYPHRNPVKRGLVVAPEDWAWSSLRHYATGEDGPVEIESQWTGRTREQLGIYPRVSRHGSRQKPLPSQRTRKAGPPDGLHRRM